MLKLHFLLIGIACSCAFARKMERREDHHHHHHHHQQPAASISDKNSTDQHNNSTQNSTHSVLENPVGQQQVPEQISTSTQSAGIWIKDLSWLIKKLELKAKELNAKDLQAHKRSLEGPFVKTVAEPGCCG